jgi:hypothetical protein
MDKAAIDVAKALVRLSEVTTFELRGEWRRVHTCAYRKPEAIGAHGRDDDASQDFATRRRHLSRAK